MNSMRKALAILATAIFVVLAPGFVAGLVPRWISRWQFAPPLLGFMPLRYAGGLLTAFGIAVLLDCVIRFPLQGTGTPAPVFPTRRLVVSGLYRYVRNPMYVAVVSTILGQAFLFGDPQLLAYGAFVWVAFHLFVLVYEEPTLRASFGREYESYLLAVPRWIPRFHGYPAASDLH